MSSAVAPIFGVLGSCMGCMVFVENIAKQEPAAMNLMTFSTFLFISSIGLVFTSKFFTVKNKIPLEGYIKTVSMFFFVNVVNNQALNFHVPVPLHIIFRSGSLLATLVLSVLIAGKTYSARKYISVFAITVGIVICTLATSSQGNSDFSMEEASKHYKEWSIGIIMLIFALIASAYLAICQQQMYEKYGKHPDEAMFITHFVSLPFFLIMGNDIVSASTKLSASAPYTLIPGIPSLWVDLFASCILQYGCIKYVYQLNSRVDSLTVTLVVTIRKFLSLIVSIFYFKNPFTAQHWLGAILVFAGTFAFADIWGGNSPKKQDEKKNNKFRFLFFFQNYARCLASFPKLFRRSFHSLIQVIMFHPKFLRFYIACQIFHFVIIFEFVF
uniref:UAA transporter n=1 Tax=Caenorhabditis tropicalis TaxID=1561998 RepID=A0A1I7UNQ4_9PELO